MNCPRCRGLMLRDESLDLADETGQYRFPAWRCVICGEVLDPLIAEHRRSPLEPMSIEPGSPTRSTIYPAFVMGERLFITRRS